MHRIYHQESSRERRRDLRKHMPNPEEKVWYYLRDRRFHGYKFRRQYSIERYVVDFYTAKPRLAIEIDGASHFTDEAQKYDKQRQEFIESCGIQILRFTNTEVLNNMEEVLQRIHAFITSSLPFSSLEEKGKHNV